MKLEAVLAILRLVGGYRIMARLVGKIIPETSWGCIKSTQIVGSRIAQQRWHITV